MTCLWEKIKMGQAVLDDVIYTAICNINRSYDDITVLQTMISSVIDMSIIETGKILLKPPSKLISGKIGKQIKSISVTCAFDKSLSISSGEFNYARKFVENMNKVLHDMKILNAKYKVELIKFDIEKSHTTYRCMTKTTFVFTIYPEYVITLAKGTHSRQTRSPVYKFSRSPLYDRNLFRILAKLSD